MAGKVYIAETENGVEIASFPFDHPDREKYQVEVKEVAFKTTPGATFNVIRNVLEKAGVEVICE